LRGIRREASPPDHLKGCLVTNLFSASRKLSVATILTSFFLIFKKIVFISTRLLVGEAALITSKIPF